MTTAKAAVAPTLTRARRTAAALARAPSIPLRRQTEAPPPKRVSIVLRRGMSQREYRQVEAQLDQRNLVRHPIIFGHKKASLAEAGPLCGLIITGGDMAPSPDERYMITEVVHESMQRETPVLALSDAIDLVLDAAGLKAPKGTHLAVLIEGKSVKGLGTSKEVASAIEFMSQAPMR